MRCIVLLIFSVYFFALFRSVETADNAVNFCAFTANRTLPGLQQQNKFRLVRLADGRCCYRTPTRYVCWPDQPLVNKSSAVIGTPPLSFTTSIKSDNFCASVPEHVRHGCKMVAQIWAEGRKAEAEGRIVSPGDLPPPSSGIGLPCFRDATREEQEAQPPPTVVAERYACLNITCLCPFFGGVSSAHDHCSLDGLSTATEAVSRARRQSGTPNLSLGRAVRMEYRMLSENQRARFHAALQQLKRGIGSYEYDRLSFLHSNPAMMPSAHGGPTFLLWHREFVKRFEIALRAVDPSVAVPYWDSSMDGRLTNPADSIMWSSLFMGALTGAGTIADGPLANWITPSGGPIRRQLGSGGGALFTEQQIASLIRTPQIANILAFTRRGTGGCPASNPANVLELIHNNIHIWVGGDMGPLTTSPQDPIFFMHHSFIDYIFEQWRQLNQNRQQRETQFPDDGQILACAGSPNFRRDATMLPFQDPVVLNGAGLSNSYTDSLYTYAPRPSCRAPGGCGSPYLFCDTVSGGGIPLCTARIKLGGNCARFATNADSPCFSSACVNGRCQGGFAAAPQPAVAARQQKRSIRSIASVPPSYEMPKSPVPYHTQMQVPNQHARLPYTVTVTTTPMPPTSSTSTEPTAFAWRGLTTPSPTPPPPKRHICYDKHECCVHWSAVGACGTAPRYMNTWCPGSCRFDGCQPAILGRLLPTECRDLHSQCSRWARFHETRGYGEGWLSYVPNRVLMMRNTTRSECERNAHWMWQNCAKTCGQCAQQKNMVEQCSKNIPKDYILPTLAD